MTRLALILALSAPLLLGGCVAPRVVADRNFGRIDGDRSISTNTDLQWTITHEPSAGTEAPH